MTNKRYEYLVVMPNGQTEGTHGPIVNTDDWDILRWQEWLADFLLATDELYFENFNGRDKVYLHKTDGGYVCHVDIPIDRTSFQEPQPNADIPEGWWMVDVIADNDEGLRPILRFWVEGGMAEIQHALQEVVKYAPIPVFLKNASHFWEAHVRHEGQGEDIRFALISPLDARPSHPQKIPVVPHDEDPPLVAF